MSVQSWQIPCPKCGWANSGANVRCAKCGQPLAQRPGMLVAGQSQSQRASEQKVPTKVARPGGFMPRLIALIIDSFVMLAVVFPLQALWAAQLTPTQVTSQTNLQLETAQRNGSLSVALFLLYLFYFAGSWAMLSATPGQLLMGLRVTDSQGHGIGFFRGVLRYLLMGLLGILAPISALMVAVGRDKRALHDLLAGTYVIQVVDAAEAGADSGLPPSFNSSKAAAPTASPPPAPPPAVAAPAPAMAALSTAPAEPEPSVPPPPLESTDFVPAPPAQQADFPAPPPAPTAPVSPDPYAAPMAPPPGSDQDLYAPPPMVDPGTSLEDFMAPAAPAPTEREVYSPAPGQISERAVRSAELYADADSLTPPVEPAPPPAEPAPLPAAPPPPEGGGELPPIEFPPMAPAPEDKK